MARSGLAYAFENVGAVGSDKVEQLERVPDDAGGRGNRSCGTESALGGGRLRRVSSAGEPAEGKCFVVLS